MAFNKKLGVFKKTAIATILQTAVLALQIGKLMRVNMKTYWVTVQKWVAHKARKRGTQGQKAGTQGQDGAHGADLRWQELPSWTVARCGSAPALPEGSATHY